MMMMRLSFSRRREDSWLKKGGTSSDSRAASKTATGRMDQLSRPKTRGLEASEAEEDAKLVKAAMSEPNKYFKRAIQKLKHEYGGNRDSDEEERLFYQQPPFDDDPNVEVKPRRRRGGGRRNFRRKKVVPVLDGGEEEICRKHTVPAKFTAVLKEELKPRVVPFNSSALEYQQASFKVGDIVSLQKEDMKYYAQILSFHSDQFCERYASIQWLIPRYWIDEDDPQQPPLTIESFKGAVPADDPVSLTCFRFVLRPLAHYFQTENQSTVNRDNFYLYEDKKWYFDCPSDTLSSTDKRY